MRLVVVLATLSRKIDQQIFQPSYLISDSGVLREILSKVAESEVEREAHFRSVMLAIDPASQKENLQSKMQTVLREVSYGLYPLLSKSQYGVFQDKVQKVIENAVKLWKDIQCSSQKYETEFDPKYQEGEWCPFEFPGFENELNADILGSHHLAVYPQLSLIQGGDRHCLECISLLPQSHKLCNLAADEMAQSRTSLTITSLPARKPRRPSVSANGALANEKRLPEGKINATR